MTSLKALEARRKVAKTERDQFKPLMDEAYQYAIPSRRSIEDNAPGEKRVNQVFDHTAIDAAFRFAGKLQQDLWPAGQENFQLEPGPIVRAAEDRDQMKQTLGPISEALQAFFDDGDWDMAFHEMALDLCAGTGAILMNGTSDPDKLWEPISVPINELMLENGPNNKISGIYWDRKMTMRVLKETWPEGDFSEDLQNIEREKPDEKLQVHCDTIWVPAKSGQRGHWEMIIWCDKQKRKIYSSTSRTCPWLTPRYFRVPGETYGRGPVMLAMPTIKTVNTAARLQLQAAAIAMLGIYTAVDDGVFNPDLSPLTPGAFWKVARNEGSAMGPSVSRFPDPRLDLTGIVVEQLQMGIKTTMMDQALPVETAAVKSATEIIERVKRLAQDYRGAFGRLVKEIVMPAVKRVIELAYNKGMLPNEIPIDQLLVRIRVKSPLAIAREMERVQKILEWFQAVVFVVSAADGQNPNAVKRIANVDRMLTDLSTAFGVPNEFVTSVDDRRDMDRKEQERQAAAALAAAAGGMA